jgi:hypothetical protein
MVRPAIRSIEAIYRDVRAGITASTIATTVWLTIAARRLRRNVFHPCDLDRNPDHISANGRFTDIDAEHQQLAMDPRCSRVGSSLLIRRISARSSGSILGLPPRRQDFQRQYARKPRRCQRSSVSGLTMMIASSNDWNSRDNQTSFRRSTFRSRILADDALCVANY